jgi:hypothetical protein
MNWRNGKFFKDMSESGKSCEKWICSIEINFRKFYIFYECTCFRSFKLAKIWAGRPVVYYISLNPEINTNWEIRCCKKQINAAFSEQILMRSNCALIMIHSIIRGTLVHINAFWHSFENIIYSVHLKWMSSCSVR